MKLQRFEFNTDGSKGPPLITCCDICHLNKNNCGLACEYNYFKIVKEPEEIQSEYDHKKERLKSINNYMGDLQCDNATPTDEDKQLFSEIPILKKWLKDNPKECWETCTKENTKVGDEVFLKNGNYAIIRKVDFIFRCGRECVLTFNDTGGQGKCILSDYEINTNKQGDE